MSTVAAAKQYIIAPYVASIIRCEDPCVTNALALDYFTGKIQDIVKGNAQAVGVAIKKIQASVETDEKNLSEWQSRLEDIKEKKREMIKEPPKNSQDGASKVLNYQLSRVMGSIRALENRITTLNAEMNRLKAFEASIL